MEEEIVDEQDFQKISEPVNDKAMSKVKTEVKECKVLTNDNVVNGVEELKTNVSVKEELRCQEDEEARLQKEFDMFEHEWVRELKQEPLDESQVQEASATHVCTVIKEEKKGQTEEMCEVASCKEGVPTKIKSEKVNECDCCKQKNEDFDANKQILQIEEEELHTVKIEEAKNIESGNISLESVREEVGKKRARNWQSDNRSWKIPHRYAY